MQIFNPRGQHHIFPSACFKFLLLPKTRVKDVKRGVASGRGVGKGAKAIDSRIDFSDLQYSLDLVDFAVNVMQP